jgi:formylglycine-generating enzyme required for sulfatase activity
MTFKTNPLALLFVWVVLAAAWLSPAQAQAPRRVAVLIGNANYVNEKPLVNPHADAALLARTFRQDLKFTEVIERKDLNRQQLFDLVEELRTKAYKADAVVVYFSGHGMRGPGGNYLIPVDARIGAEAHLRRDAVAASELVEVLQASQARVALLVLDACRDNPYTVRAKSASKGLSRMQVTGGNLLVAYATADGATADDGQPGNSPYARALNEQLQQASRPVLAQLDAVRRSVIQATGSKQNPTREGDLESDVVLVPGLDAAPGVNPTATVLPEVVKPPVLPGTAGSLSLDDLKREQAAREEWANWQQRMQVDFDAAAGFSGSADLQAKAWERFLAAWAQDNPYSKADEALRNQAQQRLNHAQAQARAETNRPTPQPSSTLATTTAAIGTSQAFTVNGVSFQMQSIPAGSFLMGSPESEPGRDSGEGPQRQVSVPAFQLGQTEVTQGLWQAVMGSNRSQFKNCGPNCPVEHVSWNDVQAFIHKLNQQTGQQFRLPSEAEWEYAARAGTTTPYPWGSQASHEHANYGQDQCCGGLAQGRDRWEHTAPASQFPANAFGLHDMHGNVLEWVQDCHAPYGAAPSDGGSAELSSCSLRGLRGGSWAHGPRRLRSASRFWGTLDARDINTGFRLARTVF